MRIVHVSWVDSSYAAAGWHMKDDVEELVKEAVEQCESIGFVIHETDEALTLALSIATHQYGAMMTIPKLAIKATTEVNL